MKEYIMPIDDTAIDWDEMFVGVIRKQEELIRCKDCAFKGQHDDIEIKCSILKRWVSVNFYCGFAGREEE